MSTTTNNTYQEFNNFQTDFYTNKEKFESYSKFDFKKNGFILLSNLAKGFPALSDLIINLKGYGWDGFTSPSVLIALQQNFVKNYKQRIPNFIYFKTEKPEKEKKSAKKTNKGLIFSDDIVELIKSIMFMDSKTYEYLQFSYEVQKLGKELLGEFVQQESMKKVRKNTPHQRLSKKSK
jgi:hypothetical protein